MGMFNKEKASSVEEKEHYESEKNLEGTDLTVSTVLPAGAATNSEGVPTYVGLTG